MAISGLATTAHRVLRVDADAYTFAPDATSAGPTSGLSAALGTVVGAGRWLTEFDASYPPEHHDRLAVRFPLTS
ncbi:MAG: hypothetical protein ABJA34_07305 [Pseudonocardiales bacterium]